MRTTLIISLLCLFSWTGLWAQVKFPETYGRNDRFAFDEADFAFYQGDYATALGAFQALLPKAPDFAAVNHRIGACLLRVQRHPEKALPHLQMAAEQGFQEAWFDYGVALRMKGDLENAQSYLERYGDCAERDQTAAELERQVGMIREAKRLMAKPVDVIVRNLGPSVNTAADEYVPLITSDDLKLFFTSRRDDSTARLKDPNGEYFEDIYVSERPANGDWQKATNLGMPVNSETHDATVGITRDGRQMILYRTNPNQTGGDLYTSQWQKDKWSAPVKLGKEINTEFQEASACFSTDGQTLYFSSNRPGGFGGKDLYRVKKLPNGNWSLPLNLGPTVNTAYDEDAPFMDENGVLYFASNGHPTMGGFDLFKTARNEFNAWSAPSNIGYPINTTGDDLYLSINAGGRKAYYSSAKPGGFGGQDIYEINFIYRYERQVVVKGQVLGDRGELLPAVLTVIDEDTHTIQGEYRSNPKNGQFILALNPLTHYSITVSAEGYSTVKDEMYYPDFDDDFREESISPYVLIRQ